MWVHVKNWITIIGVTTGQLQASDFVALRLHPHQFYHGHSTTLYHCLLYMSCVKYWLIFGANPHKQNPNIFTTCPCQELDSRTPCTICKQSDLYKYFISFINIRIFIFYHPALLSSGGAWWWGAWYFNEQAWEIQGVKVPLNKSITTVSSEWYTHMM